MDDPFAGVASPIKQADPFAGVASPVAQGAAPSQPEQPGFLSRVGTDLSNRWQEGKQAASDYNAGKITAPEMLLASTGKVVAGSANDIAREATSAVTPDIVKQGLAAGAQKTADAIDKTSVGQKVGDILLGASNKYDQFSADHPRAMRNIESAGNILSFIPMERGVESAVKSAPAAYNTAKNLAAPAISGFEAASEKLPGMLGDVTSGSQATAKLTPDMLETAATMRYGNAEKMGGVIKPEGFTDTLSAIKQKVGYQTPEGIAFAGENPVTDTLKRLDSLNGKPISLAGLDEIDGRLNSDISVAMRAGDKESAGKLLEIKSMLKNASNTVKPADLANPKAFDEWRAGDALWTAKSKMQQLQNGIDTAYMTDNPDTAMRNFYKNLSKQLAKNPQGWTPQEIAMINQSGQRGLAAGALKIVGSRLMSGLVGAAAGTAGGPMGTIGGALAGEAIGYPMRAAANALQEGRAMAPMAAVAARPSVTLALPAEISDIMKLPRSQQTAALSALKQRP